MKLRERTTDFGSFARRHIGPSEEEMREMLRDVGFENLDALIAAAVPPNIRLDRELNLPEAKSETEALAELHAIAKKNKVARSFIGAGYYDCITPPVIQRNILENPGWYTAYTPYQAELAQGRLEALVNFQTMMTDLTGLDIANASLLDEATAGADVTVGNTQRFGVPMGFGGPHAAYFATRDQFKRHMPGRLVGVSHDAEGRPAYRLALQTREQHIRRDKATSNICTAQVLLAVIASMYAVYHGPKGLRAIAERVHRLTSQLADGLRALGCTLTHGNFFDTVHVEVESSEVLLEHAARAGCNLRALGPRAVGISFDETTTPRDIELLMSIFRGTTVRDFADDELSEPPLRIPQFAMRTSDFLTHPIFNTHDTETEMLRYLKKLELRDLSLTTSMITLGSCTMKLDATAERFPISVPKISQVHPFVRYDHAQVC